MPFYGEMQRMITKQASENKYKSFDEYLELDYGDNYWGDVGVVYAGHLLEDFSENDWSQLRIEAGLKSKEWQYRCADALGDVPTMNSFEMLISFLDVDDREIVFNALSSIDALASMGVDLVDFSSRINAEIENLRVNASEFEIFLLDHLSSKIAACLRF